MAKKKNIPFDFVLDNLFSMDLVIRPMFGCHALYSGEKIILVLRKKEPADEDNGVWIATGREYHAELKKEFPSMRPIRLLGNGPGNWQMIPEEADDFESSVIRACELVLKGDPRIGRIPAKKKKKQK